MAFSEPLKVKVRKKAHLMCCLCKEMGVEVHHIIPQEDAGPDTEDNAAPLCPTCHETYGANPKKRKFIREARDLWYEICESRYASYASKIDEIKTLLKKSVSYDDFVSFKDELIDAISTKESNVPRTESDIVNELDILFDKIWYDRHMNLRAAVDDGRTTVIPEIWQDALKAARKLEKKYAENKLGPWTDFEWGMLNGKMSALHWILGDEWDMLDT